MRTLSRDSVVGLVGVSIALFCILFSSLLRAILGHHFDALGTGFLAKILFVDRLVALTLLALLLGLAFVYRAPIKQALSDFWNAAASPINLAIFRIVIFATLLWSVNFQQFLWFSRLPRELQVLPGISGWALKHAPMGNFATHVAYVVFACLCVTGLIGLYSRVSAAGVTLLGIYVLGVPQMYGKVNHNHHLIWFTMLLAVSPCADMLACDAILAAWKRADRGDTRPPAEARFYAAPLRVAWLLIGFIYFFPGLWKTASAGYAWAFSDNLRNLMYGAWFNSEGWHPLFRVDQLPGFGPGMGITTMIFEVGFVFWLFAPRTRALAALAGLAFHNGNALFMRISFAVLQTCYVVFVNWSQVFRSLGRRWFPAAMIVLYDGNCGICRRTIASLRVFDVLERITWVNALDTAAVQAAGADWLDPMALVTDMHAVVDKNSWKGYEAYRALAPRLPILWPLLPWLYLPSVIALGNRFYRRVADSRACSLSSPPLSTNQPSSILPPTPHRAFVVVTATLLLSNFLTGAFGMSKAWPFACYPIFEGVASSVEVSKVEACVTLSDRTSISVFITDDPVFTGKFSRERLNPLLSGALEAAGKGQPQRLKAFWRVYAQYNPKVRDATQVQFYWQVFSARPEDFGRPPLRRVLFTTLHLRP